MTRSEPRRFVRLASLDLHPGIDGDLYARQHISRLSHIVLKQIREASLPLKPAPGDTFPFVIDQLHNTHPCHPSPSKS